MRAWKKHGYRCSRVVDNCGFRTNKVKYSKILTDDEVTKGLSGVLEAFKGIPTLIKQ